VLLLTELASVVISSELEALSVVSSLLATVEVSISVPCPVLLLSVISVSVELVSVELSLEEDVEEVDKSSVCTDALPLELPP
jgi:hypothetical protein